MALEKPLDEEALAAIRRRYEQAYQTVSDLCNGRQQWIMSVPARPNHDPDLVIGASLRDVPDLIDEVTRLRNQGALDAQTEIIS